MDKNGNVGLEVTIVTQDELARISQLTVPNQVLAIVEKLPNSDEVIVKKELVLALDRIQDPGNLGTIIRIADWFGITKIYCNHDCADVYNPKVIQATMGSFSRVDVVYIDLLAWLTEMKGVAIYAAALDGDDVKLVGKISEGILVIGNESKGISQDVFALVTKRITIARRGRAESLNAAVATGIILERIT